jgi:hypothetical protein
MAECNPLSTPMEQNLKLASKEGNEFEDVTVLQILSIKQPNVLEKI